MLLQHWSSLIAQTSKVGKKARWQSQKQRTSKLSWCLPLLFNLVSELISEQETRLTGLLKFCSRELNCKAVWRSRNFSMALHSNSHFLVSPTILYPLYCFRKFTFTSGILLIKHQMTWENDSNWKNQQSVCIWITNSNTNTMDWLPKIRKTLLIPQNVWKAFLPRNIILGLDKPLQTNVFKTGSIDSVLVLTSVQFHWEGTHICEISTSVIRENSIDFHVFSFIWNSNCTDFSIYKHNFEKTLLWKAYRPPETAIAKNHTRHSMVFCSFLFGKNATELFNLTDTTAVPRI